VRPVGARCRQLQSVPLLAHYPFLDVDVVVDVVVDGDVNEFP
jgi:hypothetical protein